MDGLSYKNYQERHLPLNRDALIALMVLKQKKLNSDFVFHRADGSQWKNARRIQKGFSELIKTAGLHNSDRRQNVTIHTLRHSFGSQLAIRGIPLRKIQKLMGHGKRVAVFDGSAVQSGSFNMTWAIVSDAVSPENIALPVSIS